MTVVAGLNLDMWEEFYSMLPEGARADAVDLMTQMMRRTLGAAAATITEESSFVVLTIDGGAGGTGLMSITSGITSPEGVARMKAWANNEKTQTLGKE